MTNKEYLRTEFKKVADRLGADNSKVIMENFDNLADKVGASRAVDVCYDVYQNLKTATASTTSTRELIQKRLTNDLPAHVEKEVLTRFDAIAADKGEDFAERIIAEAVAQYKKLNTATASINAPLKPLSPAGKVLHNELENFNANGPRIETNSLVRLREIIKRHNAALSKCSAQIRDKDGNLVDALSQDELKALAEKIPAMVKERDIQYSAFASSGYAQKLKAGLVFDHCEI